MSQTLLQIVSCSPGSTDRVLPLPPQLLLRALGLNEHDFKFGLTKLFFRPGKFAEFDQIMKSDPDNLAALVARVRKWLVMSRWKQAQWCALSVIKLRNKILYRRQNLVLLQSQTRGYLARKHYRHRYQAVMKVGVTIV